MLPFQPIDDRDKGRFYDELEGEISGLLDRAWFTNLANVSASLMAHLRNVNWVGFYLAQDGELVLGPFQGLPACLRIPFRRGVCGTAAETRRTVLVDDVGAFPGHIVCDSRSLSEIVVPLISGDRLLGVLDVDAPVLRRFDQEDMSGLESIARRLVAGTDWPDRFF